MNDERKLPRWARAVLTDLRNQNTELTRTLMDPYVRSAFHPGDIVEIEVPARSSTSKDGMRYRGRLVSRET